MRTNRKFNSTLPHELAAAVRATEGWLHSDVVSAFANWKADPSLARSVDEVRQALAKANDGLSLVIPA